MQIFTRKSPRLALLKAGLKAIQQCHVVVEVQKDPYGQQYTAADVYQKLSLINPSISRAPVYKTLHAFAAKGFVQCVFAEGGGMSYGADIQKHSAFTFLTQTVCRQWRRGISVVIS